MSGARERLFLAERAVLYATRFDFVVEHPVTLLLQALQQPPLPSVLCVCGRLAVAWGHDMSGWFSQTAYVPFNVTPPCTPRSTGRRGKRSTPLPPDSSNCVLTWSTTGRRVGARVFLAWLL